MFLSPIFVLQIALIRINVYNVFYSTMNTAPALFIIIYSYRQKSNERICNVCIIAEVARLRHANIKILFNRNYLYRLRSYIPVQYNVYIGIRYI